ncbi:protease modulator HflC [Mucisphaera calidilacus]|uniref:Protein HflC n=1 Tax=Mucisphaera calidilacus TaxID=2527982 RepID=A0A518C0J0_9BACT|nr:protease modulator HflC [Mucisphaera calidilacus]QDU72756.1 Modulator of FtsH protease HflC [Mucisphaera calidilacus]
MKDHIWTLIIAVAVVCVLLFYTFSYTVRYDEVAVITRFDSVVGDVAVEEPGLGFRWPLPIDRVYKYSKKLQLLEDQLEEFQTSDGYAVILRTDLTWRIEDPIAFFRSLRTVEKAQEQLRPLIRELTAVVSKYRFDQLVNNDPSMLALPEIEAAAKAELTSKLAGLGFGIAIERVGVRRLILPESTTEKVFERMRTTREALAEKARAEGRARASTIRSDAESARDRILAFAQRRAEGIRSEGLQEAASYYEAFKQNEELAIFLNAMQSLQEILANNTKFILDSGQIGASELFGEVEGVSEDE